MSRECLVLVLSVLFYCVCAPPFLGCVVFRVRNSYISMFNMHFEFMDREPLRREVNDKTSVAIYVLATVYRRKIAEILMFAFHSSQEIFGSSSKAFSSRASQRFSY